MNLADSKKQNNISEYIIHMYQTEDLIRVYDFDMEKIEEYVIKHIPVEEKEPLKNWYSDVAKQMKEEGITEKGHLSEVQEIVTTLTNLKDELLQSDEEFKKIYNKSSAHINKSLEYAQGQLTNEVQACLNGVYGLLLLRMNGKKVADELMESINAFGDVLSYLSYKYKQRYYMNDN
ncbi:DUF4924 family protein [Fulvivirga sp. RKSG066]|uniref:DUF4924 family protein n=1 Tax=Fulvivirga aurantia TaxID=2529383 RepID=UPI0012BB8E3B|nr:DUF4924 family protein [Fulvivirga aurantia]MTI19868.1 DUF4924 family protein [Fulvivirga aurantia]